VLLVLSGLSMFHPMLFLSLGVVRWRPMDTRRHPWIGTVLMISLHRSHHQFWRDEMWTRDDLAWARPSPAWSLMRKKAFRKWRASMPAKSLCVWGNGSPGAGAFLQRSRHMGSLLFILYDDRTAADRLADS